MKKCGMRNAECGVSRSTIDMQGLMLEITMMRRRSRAALSELCFALALLLFTLILVGMAVRVQALQAESAAALDRSEALLAEVRAGIDKLELETRNLEPGTFNLPTAGGSR